MRVIYKYPVEISSTFVLILRKGARVLSVQVQGNAPVLWALLDTDAPSEARTFHLRTTGTGLNEYESAGAFIGTFQLDEGRFVGHLFEEEKGAE